MFIYYGLCLMIIRNDICMDKKKDDYFIYLFVFRVKLIRKLKEKF